MGSAFLPNGCLNYCKRRLLHAVNPWAGQEWCKLLIHARDEFATVEQPFAVTLLDREWDLLVSDYTHVDPTRLRGTMQETHKQLKAAYREVPFLFFVDTSVDFRARSAMNVVSAFIRLEPFGGTREQLRRANRRFASIHYGAPALIRKLMRDDGWLSYCVRDTRLGNHWWPARLDQPYGRQNEPICSGPRKHLLRLFHNITKPELCIASGTGLNIKRRALRLVKARDYVASVRAPDWSVTFPGKQWSRLLDDNTAVGKRPACPTAIHLGAECVLV
jgi:hypothetical protein